MWRANKLDRMGNNVEILLCKRTDKYCDDGPLWGMAAVVARVARPSSKNVVGLIRRSPASERRVRHSYRGI